MYLFCKKDFICHGGKLNPLFALVITLNACRLKCNITVTYVKKTSNSFVLGFMKIVP
jgi:hypothetical protein